MADTSELLTRADELIALLTSDAAKGQNPSIVGAAWIFASQVRARLQAEAPAAACPYCKGKGHVPGDPEGAPIEDCPKCGGSGAQAEAQAPAAVEALRPFAAFGVGLRPNIWADEAAVCTLNIGPGGETWALRASDFRKATSALLPTPAPAPVDALTEDERALRESLEPYLADSDEDGTIMRLCRIIDRLAPTQESKP